MMSKVQISISENAGVFAENKDVAKKLREDIILPNLSKGAIVIIDYSDVKNTTQSFTHALISEAIRQFGSDVLDKLLFKNCNNDIQTIIGIVVEYMQGNMDSPIPQ